MADRKTAVHEMAGRVRFVAQYLPVWKVEQLESLSGAYLVTKAGVGRVQMHLTSSDRNHMKAIEQDLNALGFAEDEAKAKEMAEELRQEKLREDQERAKRRLELAEERAKALAKAAGPYGPAQVTIQEILANHPAPMTYHRVLVTPEMAALMLERNRPTEKAPWPNRKLYPSDVEFIKAALRTSQFVYTHQGVAFDWDGRLQDGQTRLTAIKETGIPAELMISVGMDPENFAVVDANRKRTAGQVLQMDGVINANTMASAVRLIYLHEVWGAALLDHSRDKVPPYTLKNVRRGLDQDELGWAVKMAYRLRHEIGGKVTSPVAAFYQISRKLPANDPRVAEFVDLLINGVEGPDKEAHPVFQLRRQLFRQAVGQTRKQTPAEQMALIVKGWNEFADSFARGEYEGEHLVIRSNSKMPAIFLPPPVAAEELVGELEAATA